MNEMKKVWLMTMALPGLVAADAVHQSSDGRRVVIKFDEPVVPLSVVQNSWNEAASAQDRGLDLFDITGDAQFTPEARWIDQDRLQLSYRKGFAGSTVYRVAFRPGSARYLSGKAMPESSFEFSYKGMELSHATVTAGLPYAAACVYVENPLTRAQIDFSSQSAVTYVFREVVNSRLGSHEAGRYGRTVKGVPTQAKLRHLDPHYAFRVLFGNRKPGEMKAEELAALSLDTPIPGYVLVQPEGELPGSCSWELGVDPDEGTDLLFGTFSTKPSTAPSLSVGCALSEQQSGKEAKTVEPSVDMMLRFGVPVLKSELVDIYRSISLTVGGVAAVSSEDGRSKTVTLPDGKTLSFVLQEPEAQKEAIVNHMTPATEKQEEVQTAYSYDPPIVSEMKLKVQGCAPFPQVVDVTLPAGTRAMLGAVSREDITCRLSLTPAVPVLASTELSSPLLLPLAGNHELRLKGCNLSSLQVSAARLSPEQALKYLPMLSKTHFGTVDALIAAQYELARLRTRQANSSNLVTRDDIRRHERQVANALNDIPNVAALRRHMDGVVFSAEQTITPSGEGIDGVRTIESVVNLDSLMGGKALPGYYLVSVRRTPTADVQQQLRSVGADVSLFNSEQWFAVLLTDLNLFAGTDALAVTRLSDGSPVQQGQLLQEGKEPVAVQNAVAVVPPHPARRGRRYNETRWLALQCGDDYRPIQWRDNRTDLSTDSRMELVCDRGMYRPGETVHVRGILRSVSPQGEAALPTGVRTVAVTARKPNGEVLQQKNVRVNEHGAFEYELTLPAGDEDVTGDYRIMIQSGNYRAYAYVPCQVFRRDAFELKTELTMDSVRPTEYSLKLTATDLNGTPLSGGTAKVQTTLQVKGTGMPATPTTHNLTLGADGTATITGKVGEMPDSAVDSWLSVTGEVANDRQEMRRLPGVHRNFYPADFMASLADSDRLTLMSVGDGEQRNKVLNRDQMVHLRLISRLPREKKFPNGVCIADSVRLPLWEGDVTVPADCGQGMSTGLYERWLRFADSLTRSAEHANPPMIVELTATDAAGRKLAQTFRPYRPRREFSRPGHMNFGSCKAEVDGAALKVQAWFRREGQVVAVLRSVHGVRALPVQQVKEGLNEFTLPLQPGETGEVNLCFMQAVQKSVYDRLESLNTSVNVPNTAAALKVELNLPQQSPRPGERISLSGKVMGADGQPISAQVTLFAVDAGMLSVNRYRVPNLLQAFTHVWVPGFNPRENLLPVPGENIGTSLMRGVWCGELIGKDGSVSHAPVVVMPRMYRARNTAFAVKRAARGGNAVAVEDDSLDMAVEEDSGYGLERVQAEGAMEYAEPMAMDCAAPKAAPMPNAAVETSTVAGGAESGTTAPRLRTNFIPVAVWAPALNTDSNGVFTTEVTLPDTFTTYKVFALALGTGGKTFGNGEGEFTVNQPVMLTPGTPLFMSLGDVLRLPLTVTNATNAECTWTVSLEGAAAPQQVTLQAKSTTTLYFDYTAAEEGTRKLRWQAVAAGGSDAVEGCFDVRFPAPLLKEAHHLVLQEGAEPLKAAALLAPELAGSARGQMEVLLSANPLLHLYGCMELVHDRSYPCSHYGATAMMSWMLYDRLAPFSPIMAETSAADARNYVNRGITDLLKGQQEDGGISYWLGARSSSPWASAYVALVLTLAQEQGFAVPAEAMQRLQGYLRHQLELSRKPEPKVTFSPFDLYAIGRAIGDRELVTTALATALGNEEKDSAQAAIFGPAFAGCWWRRDYAVASLRFLAEMDKDKENIHADFLRWMRAVGHDYRHATTWDGGWMLIALHEYLRCTPDSQGKAVVTQQDGTQLTLGNGMTTIQPVVAPTLGEQPLTLTPTAGTAYVTVKAKALPDRTEYPGVTEKGLQITRIYEKRGADGVWREAHEFNVGDVVRVTLTCAKGDRELNYFVLEDYLPSCMEAINPEVPSQAAGLEWRPWSHWFDHKEYLSYRVRGFCTRWGGRDLLNMSYYARVKRAGVSTAPPAQAQLLYEPQTYGLSDNVVITSK